jgi:hypothetical protein
MQPWFNRIEEGLPRMKASLQLHNSSPTFNLQDIKHYYKHFKFKYTYTNIVWKPQAMQACVESQRKKLTRDYYVAKVDTMFSPKLGVIPEGHY